MNVVERIRRLLKLAESPNRHESLAARNHATDLLARHGLDLEDVEEITIETSPPPKHTLTLCQELAGVVAAVRGCDAMGNKRGSIVFRGKRRNAEAARDIYESIVEEAERMAEKTSVNATFLVGDVTPEVKEAWRPCFWFGFIPVVTARLLAEQPKIPSTASPAPPPTPPIEESPEIQILTEKPVEEKVDDVDLLLVSQIRSLAHVVGEAAGKQIKIANAPEKPEKKVKIRGLLSAPASGTVAGARARRAPAPRPRSRAKPRGGTP